MKQKTINRLINFIITICFFIGIVFTVLSVYFYYKTFIFWLIPLCVYFLVGALFTVAFFKFWNNNFTKTHFAFQMFYNSLLFGGLFCFLCFSINYYKSESVINTKTYKIIEKMDLFNESTSRHGGKSSAYLPKVVIFENESYKTLIFNYSFISQISKSDSIELELKNGLLGFKIINNFKFIK